MSNPEFTSINIQEGFISNFSEYRQFNEKLINENFIIPKSKKEEEVRKANQHFDEDVQKGKEKSINSDSNNLYEEIKQKDLSFGERMGLFLASQEEGKKNIPMLGFFINYKNANIEYLGVQQKAKQKTYSQSSSTVSQPEVQEEKKKYKTYTEPVKTNHQLMTPLFKRILGKPLVNFKMNYSRQKIYSEMETKGTFDTKGIVQSYIDNQYFQTGYYSKINKFRNMFDFDYSTQYKYFNRNYSFYLTFTFPY